MDQVIVQMNWLELAFLTDNPPDKTIGTYWPYATTIFDFTRRSMPLNTPNILNNNQLFTVTAYL